MNSSFFSSPITAKIASFASNRPLNIDVSRDSIIFSESRPVLKGRIILAQIDLSGSSTDLSDPSLSAKTSIHEYGGKCFTQSKSGIYFFCDHSSSIYKITHQNKSEVIYQEKGVSFADLSLDKNESYLYLIGERKIDNQSFAARIDLKDKRLQILHQEYDFYGSIKLSPCEKKIAMIAWNHPYMPWENAAVLMGDLNQKESFKQIEMKKEASTTFIFWGNDSTLYFNHEMKGFWNLYCFKENHVEELTEESIEFGSTLWNIGASRSCFISEDQIALIGTKEGMDDVYILSIHEKKLSPLQLKLSFLSDLYYCKGHLIFLGYSKSHSLSIFSFDLATSTLKSLRSSFEESIYTSLISNPKRFTLLNEDSNPFHFIYYPPKNPKISENEIPPSALIIKVHSGPTSHVTEKLSLETLFFTSRGIGYVEINYHGSSGHGKKFRDSLNERWGELEVKEILLCALALKEMLSLTEAPIFLKGGSAGGFSSLRALMDSSIFSGAVCYYPVCDLFSLAEQDHKFEKYYLNTLVGNLKENPQRYKERSPRYFAKKIKTPILFFQGDQDPVVPKEQTINMHHALLANGCHSQLYLFEEERHGFKKPSTLAVCLEKELEFYLTHKKSYC